MYLFNEASDSNQSNRNRDVGNEIMYNTEVLRSNFYDYNNAYILVRGNMTIAGNTAA